MKSDRRGAVRMALLVALLMPSPGAASVPNDSVTTAKIVDGQVMTADLANNAVTSAKIQAGAVGSSQILDGSVGTTDLADGSVTSGKLAVAVYTKAEVDALIASLQGLITDLQARLAQVEANPTLGLGAVVTITNDEVDGAPGPNVIFNGANVHIRNGMGSTEGNVNGLGNLIIGYNELRGGGEDDRSGSHNISVGNYNNYTGFCGVVTGARNLIADRYTVVLGGVTNVASGPFATIVGGTGNDATDMYSAVYGGQAATASGWGAVIVGGTSQTASGASSVAVGGYGNQAQGNYSTVTGGQGNVAGGNVSSVSGGLNRSTPAGAWNSWAAGSLYEAQ